MKNELMDHLSRNDLANLMALSHQSLKCTAKDQLKDLILDLKRLFAFENAVCAQAKIPDAFLDPKVPVDFLDVSYPDGYMDLYFEKNFHLTDAVLCNFLTNLTPVNWLSLDKQYGYNYPAAVLANDFNMHDGWAHGTVDPSTMSCTAFFLGGPYVDNDLRTEKVLEYIIPFYAAAYTRVLKGKQIPIAVLTIKEIEVLNWVKEGKCSWDISKILNCSSRVVDFHITNIKKKLNAVSRAQAVAIGLEHSIISF